MSSIYKYLNFTPTDEQKELVNSFLDFLDSDDQVFILSGYAGTGKTSMVLGFVEELKRRNINSVLLASTGRAAKVIEGPETEPAIIQKMHSKDIDEVRIIFRSGKKKECCLKKELLVDCKNILYLSLLILI